jgi:hypothetical protein
MDVYGHLTNEMESRASEAASNIVEQAMRFAELQVVANAK